MKLADVDFTDIISIKESEDGKTAIVEFTTTYKNISLFITLVNMDFKVPKKHAVYLSSNDKLWYIEKRAD